MFMKGADGLALRKIGDVISQKAPHLLGGSTVVETFLGNYCKGREYAGKKKTCAQ